MNMFRLSWRTAYGVLASFLAIALTFFSDMLGLLGALGYWPLIVYIPMEMHIVQNKIAKASGAIHGLYKGLKAYKAFQIKE
ncbi:hypothetical protein ACFX2A_017152 [Malus domestica]